MCLQDVAPCRRVTAGAVPYGTGALGSWCVCLKSTWPSASGLPPFLCEARSPRCLYGFHNSPWVLFTLVLNLLRTDQTTDTPRQRMYRCRALSGKVRCTCAVPCTSTCLSRGKLARRRIGSYSYHQTMKFGRTIKTSLYPEWASQYLQYSELKKEIKRRMAENQGAWSDKDEDEFVEELRMELDKVYSFQKSKVCRMIFMSG